MRSSDPHVVASSEGSNPLGGYLPTCGDSIGTENNDEPCTRAAAQVPNCPMGTERGSSVVCPLCSRQFDSNRGLSLHLRKNKDKHHQEYYHRTHEISKTKVRWNPEELYLLAKEEVNLVNQNCKSVNKELQRLFPHRTLEAIRGVKRKAEYKEFLLQIRSNQESIGNPTEDNNDQSTGTLEDYNDVTTDSKNNGLELFWKKNSCKELELVREWGLLGEIDNDEVNKKIDEDLENLAPTKIRLCKKTKTKKRFKLKNSKQRRKMEYAYIQKMYKKNRSNTIRKILEGEWGIEDRKEPGLADLENYWRKMFQKESDLDTRNPRPKNGVVWDLETPISKEEVDVGKKTQKKDSSPGPDGLTISELRKIPSLALAQRFNVWLITGYIPERCRKGVTVLIPKIKNATEPEKFRPITMTSTILRLFHKILARRMMNLLPITKQQKGFKHEDGIAQNLISVQAILENHTNNLKPLCVAFMDIRKAFDSVNHSSILLACKRIGVPNMLLKYIEALYDDFSTIIRVQGQISLPIKVKRGIRQGDPLSVPLFLMIMDWAMEGIDNNLGASIGTETASHLAFADDLVILAKTASGLQKQIDNLEPKLKVLGLEFNPMKCSTFRLKIEVRAKKWTVDPVKFLKCNGELIPAISVGSFYKYLGLRIGCMSNSQFVNEVLERKLTNLTKAPMKPQQRIYALRTHLIPSLWHPLTFMSTGKMYLKSLDVRIRGACRRWLKMPKDTPKAFFHAEPGRGGLGIPQIEFRTHLLKTKQILKFCEEGEEWSRNLIEHGALPKMCKKCEIPQTINNRPITTNEDLAEETAENLHKSLDGKGLKFASEVKSAHNWVINRTS